MILLHLCQRVTCKHKRHDSMRRGKTAKTLFPHLQILFPSVTENVPFFCFKDQWRKAQKTRRAGSSRFIVDVAEGSSCSTRGRQKAAGGWILIVSCHFEPSEQRRDVVVTTGAVRTYCSLNTAVHSPEDELGRSTEAQISFFPPRWSFGGDQGPLLPQTANGHDGLHRWVQFILTEAACPWTRRATAVSRLQISEKQWIYGGHVGFDYTKVPLILNYKNSTVKEHLLSFFFSFFLPSNGFTLTIGRYSSYTHGVQCSLMYA